MKAVHLSLGWYIYEFTVSLIKESLSSLANLMENMLAHKPKDEDERYRCFCRQLLATLGFLFQSIFLIGDLDRISALRLAPTTQPR